MYISKLPRASTPVIRLIKYIRNFLAELQIILEDRLCRFIANSNINGDYRKFGCMATLSREKQKMQFYSQLIMPLEEIAPADMVRFIALVTNNDISTFPQETFEIAKKIEFIQSPTMISRILEYVRRFQLGTHLSDVYEPVFADLIPVAAELDFPYSVCIETIIFHGAGSMPMFLLGKIVYDKIQLFVPIRFYRQCSTDLILAMFELPNGGQKMPLYNAEKIEANSHSTVILSDEMAIAFCNDSDEKMVFSTWYGGMELIEKIDWELLRGHKVEWLTFDETEDANPADKYRKAARVTEACERHDIHIEFRIFEHVSWEQSPCNPYEQWGECIAAERILSLNDFLFEAGEFGVHTAIKSKTLRCYSERELRALPERPYILDPILKPGHYCLIYGGTGVAKTWFTLALALGISRGESFIDNWTYSGKARKVLYVAGEMEPEMFGERLQKLSRREAENFFLVRESLNLADAADQERLLNTIAKHGSQVVVLDNLTTLAERGAYEAGFGKLLNLINHLKESGIAVILVHHENKAGEFKGTTKIKDVAEMSLHLVKAPGKGGIHLYVNADKVRGKAAQAAISFGVSFYPESSSSGWSTFELSASARRIFGEDDPFSADAEMTAKKTKRGLLAWQFMSDDNKATAILADILEGNGLAITAANHSMPVQAVEEFACEFDLTEENIRKHLDAVMEKVKRENGNKVNEPEVLAPALCWERMKSAKKRNRTYEDMAEF